MRLMQIVNGLIYLRTCKVQISKGELDLHCIILSIVYACCYSIHDDDDDDDDDDRFNISYQEVYRFCYSA